jgi:hypothetical protein
MTDVRSILESERKVEWDFVALSLIEESVALGPRLKEIAPSNPDLAALHDDERFRAMVR